MSEETSRENLKTQQRFARAPLEVLLTRLVFASISLISRKGAALIALRIFMTPKRRALRAFEEAVIARSEKIELKAQSGKVCLYRWGEKSSPAVLLLHGWEGRGTQLAAFIDPLLKANFQVFAMDAPAHGESEGQRTTVIEIASAVGLSFEQFPEIRYTISHSFGSVCIAYSEKQKPHISGFVSIGAPTSIRRIIRRFGKFLWLSKASREQLEATIEAKFHVDLDKASPNETMKDSPTPALIIHDRSDFEVPFEAAQEWASFLGNAELLETKGLGHRKILRDHNVVSHVIQFLQRVDGRA